MLAYTDRGTVPEARVRRALSRHLTVLSSGGWAQMIKARLPTNGNRACELLLHE
jgi:hypothetical protein